MDADEPDAGTPDPERELNLASREEAFAELADLNDEPFAADDDVDAAESEIPYDGALEAPPVVAVMVTHNAGDWLDETLDSLAGQTYANLSVLVIDAASDIDPTPRIARTLPGAFVRRLEHNVGFGPTLNEVLDLVTGASFLCLCHDDVVLDPNAIHRLVEEAFRSNAGIVGPKLVEWDDPERLVAVGYTIDKSGGRAPYAEQGELDQEQHDAVRDVFAIPGACTLIRADLFTHLGGFDPTIQLVGEDLDLCWRAHLAGARVIVAPAARVRHRGELAARRPDLDVPRVAAAHRLRTVISCYQFFHLLWILPQAFVISLLEAAIDLNADRPEHARAQMAAWGSAIRHAPSLWRSRRRVRRSRERGDRAVRQLQAHTWARLGALVQSLRVASTEDTEDTGLSVLERATSRSLVPYGVTALVIVLFLGSRDLFFGSLPAVGEFARAPDGIGGIWTTWLGGWNPMGLGSTSPVASAFAPMAFAGTITFGALDVVRRVAIVALLPIGVFGAWKLGKPLGSKRAQLTALIVYAAIPVPYNALSQGRWSGLIVYAAAPWVLAALARAMQVEPFAPPRGAADARHPGGRRALIHRVLGIGLSLGVLATFVPAIVPVSLLAALGFALGSLVTGRVAGIGRLAATVSLAALVAAVLQLPWTLGVVGPGGSWTALAGMRSGTDGWLSLGRILRFESGSFGAPPLGFAFLAAASLPLIIGRSWRFAWGARAWGCAVVCWAALWTGQQQWMTLPIPPAEVLLAPAAAALALAVASGTAAFDIDLPEYGFGWRQGVSALAAVAVLIGALPMIGGAVDGRWRVPTADFGDVLDFVNAQRAQQPFRVVWVGDPDVLPAAGQRLDDTLDLAVSNDAMPTLEELWSPGDDKDTEPLAEAVQLARDGQTTRLGSILATMGVRYLVLPRQIVPAPYSGTGHSIDTRLGQGLDDQLDLTQVPVNAALVVYRNTAWRPGMRLLPRATSPGRTVADALDQPAATPVLRGVDPVDGGSGRVPRAGLLATGQRADSGWHLTVDGRAARPVTLDGWEQGFEIPSAGRVQLTRSTPVSRPLLLVVEIVLWIAALVLWRRTGASLSPDDLVAEPGPLDPDEGSLVQLGVDGTPDEIDVIDVGETDDPDGAGDLGGPLASEDVDDLDVDAGAGGDRDDVDRSDGSDDGERERGSDDVAEPGSEERS